MDSVSKIRPLLPTLILLVAACAGPGQAPSAPQVEDAATLLTRADRHFDARSYDNARHVYEMAAVAAGGEGDDGRYVEAASQIAHVHAVTGHLEDGRDWLASATARVRRDDAPAWCRWLIARGVYERADGMVERALATFEEAFEHAHSSGQLVRAVQAAHWATVTAPDERAVRWCRSAIEVTGELGRLDLTAALWSQLGWLLDSRGLANEALEAFQRSRTMTSPSDEHALLAADWSVGRALRIAGRHAGARALMEDVEERADQRYLKSRRPNDAEWVAHAQSEMAELDLIDGKIEEAVSRMELARERFLEAGARRLAPERLAAHDQRLRQMRATLEG